MQVVIQADRLFDGTGAEPIEQAAVVIGDGRIRAVGRRDEIVAPDGEAQRVEYAGCTILPGLIDCHVHLIFSAGPRPLDDLLADDDHALLLRAVHNAQTALRAGITTVKDLGGRGAVTLALRDAIGRGLLPGPRILAAGPPITSTGGHCNWLGGEADTADELRKKVRQLVKQGVDLLKVMASGGRMTPGSNVCAAQFTVEQLRALVEDAHRLGKSVAAHGHGVAGIRNAVAAGVGNIAFSLGERLTLDPTHLQRASPEWPQSVLSTLTTRWFRMALRVAIRRKDDSIIPKISHFPLLVSGAVPLVQLRHRK